MLNELWVMIHEYLLKGKPFTCMSPTKIKETVNAVVISETCYVVLLEVTRDVTMVAWPLVQTGRVLPKAGQLPQ